MSGSASTDPHGDRHLNVKGRGPVSISTDLIAVSVKHRLNLGVGNSVRCLDQFRIPVAMFFGR